MLCKIAYTLSQLLPMVAGWENWHTINIFNIFYAYFWQTGDFAAPGINETTRITKTYTTIFCLLMKFKKISLRCFKHLKESVKTY